MEVGSQSTSVADGIVFNAEEEEESDYIVTCMDTTYTWYKIKLVLTRKKIMTINSGGFHREIMTEGQG